MERRLRVGIDVGGTFTDLLALDEDSGDLLRVKVPSTPRAPEDGVADALEALVRREGAASVRFISHSSTVATNALLGQVNLELPRAALLTTEGFRDVLEIGRQNRSEVYNLDVVRPKPLIDRERRFGVRERTSASGDVLVPLDDAAIARALDDVAACGAETVAVAFLHAYVNPDHERKLGAALRARFPHLTVALSSDVDPEYREYERTSTTVVSALLGPLVGGYLERLAARARALGIDAPIYVMKSSGGMSALATAAAQPATLIESGPASGAIAAAYLATTFGFGPVLSFDMGGTTAKAALIVDGTPQVAHEFEAAGRTHSGRSIKGSGYPVRFPFVDLAEISAGGGTIASVDAYGALCVGPLSAGADPGPAAYGRGSDATVTDANIVLGRLNGRALLGGAMPIDRSRAHAAIEAVAARLGLAPDRAAAGIVAIVDAEMAKVARIVSVERGLDPRAFTLMAFGGGGPLHACAVAEELGMSRVVVPRDPGLFSAYGLLAADLRAGGVRAIARDGAGDEPEIEAAFAELETLGRAELERQGVAATQMRLSRELDARYLGQSFELTIATSAPFDAAARRDALAAFERRHREAYGYSSPGETIELVAARSTAVGTILKPRPVMLPVAPHDGTPEGRRRANPPEARLERRVVYVSDESGRCEIDVFDRARLLAGHLIEGPATIEQYDSCTFVGEAWNARVDAFGNLILERRDRKEE